MQKIKPYLVVTACLGALSIPIQAKAMVPSSFDTQTQNSKSALSLSILRETMNAGIYRQTIGDVLKRFSQLAEVNITVSEARAKELITVNFSDVPIEKGIKRILGANYTLVYDASELPKLTDVRIVNDIAGANTQEGKIWIRYTPVADIEQGLLDTDAFIRLNILEKIQKEGGPVNLKLLSDLAINDENTLVRQIALQELAKRLETKELKHILNQAVNADDNVNIKSLAKSLLNGLESPANKNLLSLNTTFSSSSNASSQSPVENNGNSSNVPSQTSTATDDSNNTSDSSQETETISQLVQNPQENSANPESENENNPTSESDRIAALSNPDTLRIALRDGEPVDDDVLEGFATDDYPNDLRLIAIDELVDRKGYELGYEYLKQQIESETDTEILEYVRAAGIQLVNDAEWILKNVELDRAPFIEAQS